MYLMIRNVGVADYHLFTLLGASTARGDNSKIGQFGSGAKHSALTLLRMGCSPIVMLGTKELTYFTKTVEGLGKDRLWVNYDGVSEPQSMVVDFGSMDWDTPHMALREYISNAIDSGGEYSVTIVDEVKAVEGETRIFVPLKPEIMEYYNKLGYYFLHFCKMENVKHFKNIDLSEMRVYRKGVLVGVMEREKSMFHYNLPDVKVDESRNLRVFESRVAIMNYVSRSMPIPDLLKIVLGNKDLFEVNNYHYGHHFDRKEEILQHWPTDKVIGCGLETAHLEQFAKNLGKTIHQLNPGSYEHWKHFVPSLDHVTTNVVNGQVVRPLDGNIAENVNTVISYLKTEKLITEMGVQMMCFTATDVRTYIRNGILYLNDTLNCYEIMAALGSCTGQDYIGVSWKRLFEERGLYR